MAVLIAWLGTRARVEHGHLVDVLDHGDVRCPDAETERCVFAYEDYQQDIGTLDHLRP